VNNNPLSKTDADGHFMLVIDKRLVGTQQCWCEQLSSDLLSFWYHIQWNWQNNPNIWDRAYWSKSDKPAPPPPVVTPSQTANPDPDDNKKKDDKPKRVYNQKHHPNSSSPEPKNVQELYDKAIKDSNGRWWAKDADGVIHRFSRPSNGETHWNGSTVGADPIRMNDIPNEIRNALK
jgi:hypothetical protein